MIRIDSTYREKKVCSSEARFIFSRRGRGVVTGVWGGLGLGNCCTSDPHGSAKPDAAARLRFGQEIASRCAQKHHNPNPQTDEDPALDDPQTFCLRHLRSLSHAPHETTTYCDAFYLLWTAQGRHGPRHPTSPHLPPYRRGGGGLSARWGSEP